MHRIVRGCAAALVSLLALSATAAALAAPAAAATASDLVINEVEQDGSPSDWIELYNKSADPVDASGLILRDDKTGPDFVTIPDGTTIAGHGFFAIDTGEMGLGKGGDSARLFASVEATVPISSYTWTAGVDTTWGSCPDGAGTFVATVSPTKGAANDCKAPAPAYDSLVINEIEQDGSPSDWIEVYNTGAVAVDASGLVLRDDKNPAAVDAAGKNYVLVPQGTTIASHGFVTIDTGDMGLGKGGDAARLYLPADGIFPGTGANAIDSYTWTVAADETLGRCPDGIGEFLDTDGPTRNAANNCPVPAGAADIVINEVESKANPVGPDWVELYNQGATDVNVGGWLLRDSGVGTLAPLPAGKIVPAGGYLVIENKDEGGAGDFSFGLGNPDEVHLYLPGGVTEVDSYSYTDHALTTYGRCPDGTGTFVTTFQATKGAANACSEVRINEIESSDGAPGDWVELVNGGDSPVDISGMTIRDNKDEDGFTISANTTLAAHAYLVVDLDVKGAAITAGGFGLGSADSVRLFAKDGILLDSYTWAKHASTTYGRCSDTVGGFAETLEVTKGAANACVGEEVYGVWPGGESVKTVDVADSFGGDMSGLVYESAGNGTRGVLWGVNNKQGLYKLVWDGSAWVTAGGAWKDVRFLVYPNGSGWVDSEGGTFGGPTSADGFYIASERDNDNDDVSRPSILRYDVTDGSTGNLVATDEWNLASVIPGANALGANAGFEGIAWVPDSFLTGKGMRDQSTGLAYDPTDYAGHGNGLFFAGLEGTGDVYALALMDDGSAKLVATLDPGLAIVSDVTYDAESGLLWAICDDACQGRSVTFEVAQSGSFDGDFRVTNRYENAAGMGDRLVNEGMAIATDDLCVNGLKPVWYADDAETDGHALREGTINCEGGTGPGTNPGTTPGSGPGPVAPTEGQLTPDKEGDVSGPTRVVAGATITVNVGTDYAGDKVDVWLLSTPVHLGTHTVSAAGTVTVTIPANTPAGAHRIAVLAADGTTIGWYGLTVVSARLGLTSAETAVQPALALAVLAAGALLVVMGRRRNQLS